jgi:hypothetical protein
MSTSNPRKPGLYDPDDWINRWLALHPSALFAGHLYAVARSLLDDPQAIGTTGKELFQFREGDESHIVELSYFLEELPSGRLLHVLHILSPGDPLPDLTDETDA